MRVGILAAFVLAVLAVSGLALRPGGALGETATPAAAAPAAQSPGIVGIIGGDIDSTAIQIVSDMGRALDNGKTLRIVPMVGKGSLQNISDLLGLRGVDAAILQSDVMAYFKRTNRIPGLESRMRYVTKLYSEEFHVLSRMRFMCLQDLTGRQVNFGPKDSGAAITAEAVFAASQIKVQPIYLENDVALDRLKQGELDAIVYVGGKPSRAFGRISHRDRVHFLDVDYLPALQRDYLPAIMTSEDYPDLIASNENVSTIAVSAVLAVHNWNSQTERYRAMSRFIENLFQRLDTLKKDPYSSKWREVNIRAPVPGWQRFQPAEKWLVAHAGETARPSVPAQTAQQLKTMLQKFVESQRGGSSADREELFNQFVRWYQQQSTR
jgi:TRAP transporter TAXI family solute receptor